MSTGTLDLELEAQKFLELEIQPVHLGPTWEKNPQWDGVSLTGPNGKYILPEFSLGYQAWAWVREYLLSPDSSDYDPQPFTPTFEQWRFVMWWYAVDERGRFVYRRGVLQRLKGHGKDPLAAVLAAVELLGPCKFRGWARRDMGELGYRDKAETIPAVRRGDPVAEEQANAWIQIAAVTQEQTQNTMGLFPGLFSEKLKARAGMKDDNIGIRKVTAFKGRRKIQSVTSNPRALEGARPTFVILNETEHWVETNNGWEMSAAMNRNAAKSKGGAARTLAICNAPEPSEESVGRRDRDAYMDEVAGLTPRTNVLYDSLELEETVPLFPPGSEDIDDPELQEYVVVEHLKRCINLVKGDSWWLDEERIAYEILDASTPVSVARRFYFNMASAAEDAWVDPNAVNAAVDPIAGVQRRTTSDPERCGWIVKPNEPIVLFFDGSKSDDATALIGCRLSDGYTFVVGLWQAPPKKRRRDQWLAPRGEVDSRVDEAFDRFEVVAFWADPSHAKKDDVNSDEGYWDGLIDDWHRRYKEQLVKDTWAVKSGMNPHSIMWDMASPERTKQFVQAAERTVDEFETKTSDGTWAPKISIDAHPRLLEHLKNAKKAPGLYGVSLRKDGRESLRKIDAAVGLVGARLLRRLVLNSEPEEDTGGGWAIAV